MYNRQASKNSALVSGTTAVPHSARSTFSSSSFRPSSSSLSFNTTLATASVSAQPVTEKVVNNSSFHRTDKAALNSESFAENSQTSCDVEKLSTSSQRVESTLTQNVNVEHSTDRQNDKAPVNFEIFAKNCRNELHNSSDIEELSASQLIPPDSTQEVNIVESSDLRRTDEISLSVSSENLAENRRISAAYDLVASESLETTSSQKVHAEHSDVQQSDEAPVNSAENLRIELPNSSDIEEQSVSQLNPPDLTQEVNTVEYSDLQQTDEALVTSESFVDNRRTELLNFSDVEKQLSARQLVSLHLTQNDNTACDVIRQCDELPPCELNRQRLERLTVYHNHNDDVDDDHERSLKASNGLVLLHVEDYLLSDDRQDTGRYAGALTNGWKNADDQDDVDLDADAFGNNVK